MALKEREIQEWWYQNGNNLPVSDDFRAGCLAADSYKNTVTEVVAKKDEENSRVIEVLIAGGFVTPEKVDQARELVKTFER